MLGKKCTERPDAAIVVSLKSDSNSSSNLKTLSVVVGLQATVVVILLLFARWLPTSWLPACGFKLWTGWPCPLCGLTRSALALGRLEFREALFLYPFPTLLWLTILTLNAMYLLAAFRGRTLKLNLGRHGLWLLGVLTALGWINSIVAGV